MALFTLQTEVLFANFFIVIFNVLMYKFKI